MTSNSKSKHKILEGKLFVINHSFWIPDNNQKMAFKKAFLGIRSVCLDSFKQIHKDKQKLNAILGENDKTEVQEYCASFKENVTILSCEVS